MTEADQPEHIALHNDDPALRRKRVTAAAVAITLVVAAFGGVAALFGGARVGLIAAVAVALPLVWMAAGNIRRTMWLVGTEVVVRSWATRRIDVTAAERIDVIVTQVRQARTVSLLVTGGTRGSAVKIDVATYEGNERRELPILTLRKLANALMDNTEANGMVFAELLVAQLRAEAKGSPAQARPLHQLASAAPPGKFAQRYSLEAVSKFVASLD
jgi:hypothetical protein